MAYIRPDLQAVEAEIAEHVAALNAAPDYAAAREAFLAMDRLNRRVDTQGTLASIRHSIDTRDAFYDAEQNFWNSAMPELQAHMERWTDALPSSARSSSKTRSSKSRASRPRSSPRCSRRTSSCRNTKS